MFVADADAVAAGAMQVCDFDWARVREVTLPLLEASSPKGDSYYFPAGRVQSRGRDVFQVCAMWHVAVACASGLGW